MCVYKCLHAVATNCSDQSAACSNISPASCYDDGTRSSCCQTCSKYDNGPTGNNFKKHHLAIEDRHAVIHTYVHTYTYHMQRIAKTTDITDCILLVALGSYVYRTALGSTVVINICCVLFTSTMKNILKESYRTGMCFMCFMFFVFL